MEPPTNRNFGIVLLSQSIVPLFVNAEAYALFSLFNRRNGKPIPTNGNQTQTGLPPVLDRFAHDLSSWHGSYDPQEPSSIPTVFSKVVEGNGQYFQLRGGICSIALADSGCFFLITLQKVDDSDLLPSHPKHVGLPLAPLTPREHEVVTLLAQGHTNQAIADRMAISVHTVRDHVKAIRAKTGAKNKTEILIKLRVI